VLSGHQADTGHPHRELLRAGFLFSYATMMWSLASLGIGLFKWLFDKPSKVVRYLADSSYWLYLIHLPIVIWLQIAFAELAFHWSLKLIAISLLTIGISLVLYDLFVRSTVIGKTLNGRRQERVLFKWRSKSGNKLRTSSISATTESC
jgi:peptidoglycan/LPS O-acetylase OafA/YrhL